METPHINLRMSQWLSRLDGVKDKLEPLLKEALVLSCKRIKEHLRKDHPKWMNRTFALSKAIDSIVTNKLRAIVFIDEDKLEHYSNNGPYILNPNAKYKEGQDVGRDKRFPNSPFKNYANYLIEGTHSHSSKHAKAMRFVGKDGKIHFVKRPKTVKGIKGDNGWLTRARNSVNYRKIIGEVLDRHGIKHD